MRETRRKFSREFKIEAVKLVTEGGQGVAETAQELGINPNLLARWKRQFAEDGQEAFPGKGRLKPLEEEIRRLECEVKRLDAGCEVDVITTSSEMSETGSGIPQHVDGVRVFSFERRPSLGWSFSWPLTRWMLRHVSDYDLLHVHALFAYPTLASCTAARHHAIPYVLRPLGTLNPWALSFRRWKKAPYLKLIEYRNLAGAAAIHATSALEETSIRALGLPVRVVTIPLGVDIPERPEGADFRRDGDFINVLYLSRLHPIKGLEPLIDAVAALGSPVPYRLIVAGDGDPQYVRYLQDLVEQRGVGDRVQFAGFVSDAAKQQVLAQADLFVLPSYSENFGVAVA